MLYNLSEFITTIKENVGVQDLPLPVTDQDIIDHFDRVTLTDFSVCYPRLEIVLLDENNMVDRSNRTKMSFYEYTIPKFVYDGTCILDVIRMEPLRPNGYSDMFIPTAGWADPASTIGAMADVRASAGLASAMSKAPTHRFEKPNHLYIYNGWAAGVYEVECLLKHDLSLATVPEGAIYNLRLLAELDLKWYLYGKLKRKKSIETGVGSVQLEIDDWQSAESERNDKLKEWREESNIDFSHVFRY